MSSTTLKRLAVAVVVIGAMIGVALFLTRPTVLWYKTYVLPDGRHVAASINCPRQGGVYLDLTERRGWFEGMSQRQTRRIAETATREDIKVVDNPDQVTLTITVGAMRYEVNLATIDAHLTPS